MASTILGAIGSLIISAISVLGYGGVILLMAIQSANIPIPSEVIMPFAGFLVWQGTMNLWWVTLAGAVGTVLGSVFSYWLGKAGGRPLIEKYGQYILISRHDLDMADSWFKKSGELTVFLGRFLPIIRTFISFPAGIARMDFRKFVVYSFLGSIPWTLALVYFGFRLGADWINLRTYFHRFDDLILALIVLGIVWWVWRHLKSTKN
ncbi:MAG: DedA family protein [Patescibacteria group bacterium]|jgi:membrane protein DedA with SNARE-associated domain